MGRCSSTSEQGGEGKVGCRFSTARGGGMGGCSFGRLGLGVCSFATARGIGNQTLQLCNSTQDWEGVAFLTQGEGIKPCNSTGGGGMGG